MVPTWIAGAVLVALHLSLAQLTSRFERDGEISVIERRSEAKVLEVAVEEGVQRNADPLE
jgi:hypothetical protein